MKHLKICILLLIFLCFSFSSVGQAKELLQKSEIDSLENLLKANIDDTVRLKILKELSSNIPDRQKGLTYILEAKKLHNKLQLDYDYIIDYRLGFLYFVTQNDDKALEIFRKLKQYNEERNDIKKTVKVYYYLGRINSRKGSLDQSIDYYQRALKLVDSTNLDSLKGFIYSGIGNFHMHYTGELEVAKSYFMKSLEIAVKLKNSDDYIQSMLALSRLELNSNNIKKAFDYINTAIDTAISVKDTFGFPILYNTLGNLYEVTKQYDEALSYYRKSYKFYTDRNEFRGLFITLINISDVYKARTKLDSAETFLIDALKVAEEHGTLGDIATIHDRLHNLYAEKKEYEKAYNHTLTMMETWQKFQAQKIDNIRAELRLESEVNNQENDLKILKQQTEIQKLQLNKNRYLIFGLLAVLLLVLIFGFIFYRQHKNKTGQRINELTHRNLRQQMNPHFIFNTLNSIQYLLFKNKKLEANNFLSKFATLMRKLLDNSQFQSIPIKQEIEALQLYIELESLRFKDKIKYSIDIDENIDTYEYKIPTMIIQPYVENSINHGLLNKDGEGLLTVKLSLKKEKIYCEIEDNGIGREKAAEIKRNNNGGHKSLASKITESRLKLMSNLYGNKFSVDIQDLMDEEGVASGTKVCLSIPVLT